MTKFVIAFVILAIGYVASLYIRSAVWESEAGEQASYLLTEIAKPWNEKNILSLASIALKASSRENIERLQEAAPKLLGDLVKIVNTPKCNITQGVDSYSHKEFIYASCDIRAEFEKRTVNLNMRIVEQENQWLIDDLQFNFDH